MSEKSEFYRAVYRAITKNDGHSWSVWEDSNGNCRISTCPTAHDNYVRTLAENVSPSDFIAPEAGEIENCTEDEFVEMMMEVEE